MSERMGWSTKQVIVVVLIAAVAGYVLGRLSTNLRLSLGGGGGAAADDTAEYALEDPGPMAEDSDILPIANSPFLGPGAAKVTIVAFSDFECPFCRRATPVIHELMEMYEDDLKIVWFNLPLPMHRQAQPAARAALAAHRQGAFWDFHDLLFANQSALGPESYEGLAEDLDLDMDQFREDLADEVIAQQVRDELERSRALGVNGTPTFLVNGIEVLGAQPPEEFARIIDAELEAAERLIDEGVPVTGIYRRRIEANLERPDTASDDEPAEPAGSDESGQRPAVPPPAPQAPALPPDGHAELTVYADYTEASARELGRALEQLMGDYGERLDVRVESYVDPADEVAVLTAAALRFAESQGRFRELHQLVIASDESMTRERLVAWATQVGLEADALEAALDDGDLQAFEVGQRQRARAQGVVVSPTVRVGGVRLVGAVPYEDLRVAVNASMERQ